MPFSTSISCSYSSPCLSFVTWRSHCEMSLIWCSASSSISSGRLVCRHRPRFHGGELWLRPLDRRCLGWTEDSRHNGRRSGQSRLLVFLQIPRFRQHLGLGPSDRQPVGLHPPSPWDLLFHLPRNLLPRRCAPPRCAGGPLARGSVSLYADVSSAYFRTDPPLPSHRAAVAGPHRRDRQGLFWPDSLLRRFGPEGSASRYSG